MRFVPVLLLPIAVLFANRADAQQLPSCNATTPCSSTLPCCSEYGFCGTSTYCLGGCNPFASNSISSCAPEPVCQSANHTFSNLNRFINVSSYNGDADAYDWVINQGNLLTTNDTGGELVLTLSQANQGTRISSTRYVQYGTVTARIKASRWGGVVSAFITMSDVRDEIDWEFPGNWTTEGQTNYFWKGVWPTPTNGHTEDGLTDTYENYHDFTIDWQPTALSWLIDGQVIRTVNQKDTVDKNGVSQYPNTPARIEISLWPAGIPGVNEGTVAWGGGMIDWNNSDYLSAGHFYMFVKSVSITCADSTANRISGATSYTYGPIATSQTPQILVTNGSAVLATLNNSSPRNAQWSTHLVPTIITLLILTAFIL